MEKSYFLALIFKVEKNGTNKTKKNFFRAIFVIA